MDLTQQYEIESVVRYLFVTAACWICYDHSITFKTEIELVWKAPNGFMKYGFLVYRYVALAGTIILAYSASGSGVVNENVVSQCYCRWGILTLALLQTCSLAFADLIAVLHISTIWNRSYKVLITLALCYIVTFAVGVVGRATAFQDIKGDIYKFDPTDSCVVKVRDTRIVISWAAGSLFDLITLIFNFSKPICQHGNVGVCYIKSLRLYGTAYFIINFILRTTCVFSFLFDPSWMPTILPALTWPITTVTLSRFIFEARKPGRKLEDPDSDSENSQARAESKRSTSTQGYDSSCSSSNLSISSNV